MFDFAGQAVQRYALSVSKSVATLVPTREWKSSTTRIVTARAAHAVANLAIVNGRTLQQTYILTDGAPAPTIVVPASFLRLPQIKFAVLSDGEAMIAKDVASRNRAKAGRQAVRFISDNSKALKKLGLKF